MPWRPAPGKVATIGTNRAAVAPCPPIGRHHYVHKLYALDAVLAELKSPTKDKLLEAMQGHVLARAELIGTYERSQLGSNGQRWQPKYS
jgi:phosphatidylethanolamine-binding protein (PEBP) family uncharacterized protein